MFVDLTTWTGSKNRPFSAQFSGFDVVVTNNLAFIVWSNFPDLKFQKKPLVAGPRLYSGAIEIGRWSRRLSRTTLPLVCGQALAVSRGCIRPKFRDVKSSWSTIISGIGCIQGLHSAEISGSEVVISRTTLPSTYLSVIFFLVWLNKQMIL